MDKNFLNLEDFLSSPSDDVNLVYDISHVDDILPEYISQSLDTSVLQKSVAEQFNYRFQTPVNAFMSGFLGKHILKYRNNCEPCTNYFLSNTRTDAHSLIAARDGGNRLCS